MQSAPKPGIYLDWNATSPLLPEVRTALYESQGTLWANPSSVHRAGRVARSSLESVREKLAQATGFSARDVVFTSGGTEANNSALEGISSVVLSALEHPSVTRAAERAKARGAEVRWVNVGAEGRITPEAVAAALGALPDAHGATVVVTAVNHETGVIQPVDEIARVVHAAQARLHVDAVQLLGKANLDVLDAADSVALAAHKIGGPKGIGALLFRGTAPKPVLVGGAQERGLRAGTQDATLALGFGIALDHALAHLGERAQLAVLRDLLEQELAAVAEVNGARESRVTHVSNLSFERVGGAELVAALDLEGVYASSGSACSAGTPEPSTLIAAMLGPERAKGAVRFSLGWQTRPEDIQYTALAVKRVLTRLG